MHFYVLLKSCKKVDTERFFFFNFSVERLMMCLVKKSQYYISSASNYVHLTEKRNVFQCTVFGRQIIRTFSKKLRYAQLKSATGAKFLNMELSVHFFLKPWQQCLYEINSRLHRASRGR